MPSITSGAACPAARAVNQVTCAPAATHRRAIWCMYCSAPPACGCRTSRQLSTSDAGSPASCASGASGLTARHAVSPAGAAGRRAKLATPSGISGRTRRPRRSRRPGSRRSARRRAGSGGGARRRRRSRWCGRRRGPGTAEAVEELEPALGVADTFTTCGQPPEDGAAGRRRAGWRRHEDRTRGVWRDPMTAEAPLWRWFITVASVSTGVARSASKKPTNRELAGQQAAADRGALAGAGAADQATGTRGPRSERGRVTWACSSTLPLSTTTTRVPRLLGQVVDGRGRVAAVAPPRCRPVRRLRGRQPGAGARDAPVGQPYRSACGAGHGAAGHVP